MTNAEKFMGSIADRNAAIYRLSDLGMSHAEIAATLNIKEQIVINFLTPATGLWD